MDAAGGICVDDCMVLAVDAVLPLLAMVVGLSSRRIFSVSLVKPALQYAVEEPGVYFLAVGMRGYAPRRRVDEIAFIDSNTGLSG